jgi:hypothetical protein
VAYEVGRGRESLFGSLSVSSMWQVVGIFCLGRRYGEMGDGGSILYLVLRMGDCGVLHRSWVEVRSDSGGSKIGQGRSATRVVSVFRCWWRCVV